MKKLFTGEFKKNVVLEALKEEKTISELASENEIDSRQIFRWKKLVIERIEIEKLNGILSSQVVYTFDDYNNRKSMMNNDVMTDYEYDKNNRLINEVKVNNEITETTKYFYDNNGNQIYKGIDIIAPDDGSDASIGMSVVGTNTESSSVYNEYDGLNQLISTAVHDKVVLYSYDSDGLRASKSVNGSKTDYIWDGQNIVAEINNGTLTNKYIRGINLIYGENVTGIKKWYLFNGHGDVVGLSDVNGNVLKLYDYDAFGNLCQEQNYKVLANILEDDFSTGLEKWDNTRIASIISDGGLRVDYNELVRSKNTINGDFVFEVDVKIQKSSARIVFRGVDNYNYYMWQLTNGKLRPHKKVNNGWTVLKEVPASITENVMYHVKIEVVGNVIKTYINENLVDTTMDSTFSKGMVGFREAVSEIGVFDNVVVKQAGLTVFEDSFSVDLAKWNNTWVENLFGQQFEVNGNEEIRSKNTINGDFVLEVDVKIQKSSAGIVFRGVDNYNYYMWQLTNGKLRPHKKVNNGWTVLKEVPTSIDENVMYHVKIEVVGNVIKTYINENLVDTTMDSTFSNGTVGFREAPFEVGVFDNVVVKSLQDSSEVVAVNPFRYCGEFWDAETGEYYLRARYYDPGVGRFTQEDSVWSVKYKLSNGQEIEDNLSLNLYTYCGNYLINRWDPSGHSWIGDAWNSSMQFMGFRNTDEFMDALNFATMGTSGVAVGSGKLAIKGATITEKSLVSLYRAVGVEEFESIMASKAFSTINKAMQAKQFGLNFENTLKFANNYSDLVAIIEAKIPKSVLDKIADITHIDSFIFKEGTVSIQPKVLEEFNKAIQKIIHKF